MSITICLVSQEYPPQTGGGGVGTQTFLKAQGLGRRGHEVHVVSSSWDAQERTCRDGPAVIHRIAEPVLPVPGYEQSSYWLAYSTAVPYDQLPDHYAWCDLFAGPSRYEPGPGNIYLEAMSSGRPVIACNTGGAPEVVLDRETGLLVSPSDADALAQAIVALAEDGRLRRRLGENGRRRVCDHFSVDRYLDKVERHYREALS